MIIFKKQELNQLSKILNQNFDITNGGIRIGEQENNIYLFKSFLLDKNNNNWKNNNNIFYNEEIDNKYNEFIYFKDLENIYWNEEGITTLFLKNLLESNIDLEGKITPEELNDFLNDKFIQQVIDYFEKEPEFQSKYKGNIKKIIKDRLLKIINQTLNNLVSNFKQNFENDIKQIENNKEDLDLKY